jgi:serine/threonine protein kinase
MTPERYRQIGLLYHDTLERQPHEREAFLEQTCADDVELRRQVEVLISAHGKAGDFLATPVCELTTEPYDVKDCVKVGQSIAQYQVLSLLGKGGMGEVYLAQDTRLGRKLALKLLPAAYTRDAERVRRFKQEARATSSLNHPNIITIFDIGESDGTHFIAAEFIDGITLRQRLQPTSLDLREALDIAIQMASALSAAHEIGIVHRDIKPENVMLRHDGYVKILDFGLAKLTEQPPADDSANETATNRAVSTEPGIVMGTFAYMSPEQACGRDIDNRSDVFSLGVILFEMISGTAPFRGSSAAEIVAAILHRDAPPLARYARDVPVELERIAAKTLAKSRDERYQTVKDLLIDLRNLKLELEFTAKLKRAAHPQPERFNDQFHTISVLPTVFSPKNIAEGHDSLEPVGGAVPLDSDFYIVRPTDEKFHAAITRQDSIVLVKGARQVGKTSLLARGLQKAREAGAKVVLTDFQSLSSEYLEALDKLLLTFANSFVDALELETAPEEMWKPNRSPGINFELFLRRAVLLKTSAPVVWGLDEIDRLFTCDFGSELFGLFRSWHNKRALDPSGPWGSLTLAIAYATEAHLFITDLNQSPFNVGTRLQLNDFSFEQVTELNKRYGSPLHDQAEVERYVSLVSGHPYLVRCGLHEMATNGLALLELEAQADSDEGPFGDHLHRLLISLNKDAELCEVVRGILQGQPCPTPESFYRLRSAGLTIGASTRDVRLRCQLYTNYLMRHLL